MCLKNVKDPVDVVVIIFVVVEWDLSDGATLLPTMKSNLLIAVAGAEEFASGTHALHRL